jgi:hypothetical protein
MNDSHMEAKRLQEAAFNTLHAILDTTGSSESINASMVWPSLPSPSF